MPATFYIASLPFQDALQIGGSGAFKASLIRSKSDTLCDSWPPADSPVWPLQGRTRVTVDRGPPPQAQVAAVSSRLAVIWPR